MLTYFSVKNYRQFRDELVFDFSKVRDYQFSTNCVNNGYVNKAIIYGKNASGKTNLMKAMRDIFYTTLGLYWGEEEDSYRNADSADEDTIVFRYSFLLNNTIIDYQYEKKDSIHVIAEKLAFNDTVIFEYNRIHNEYHFENIGLISAEQLQWDSFQNMSIKEEDTDLISPLTALRFVYTNTATTASDTLNQLVRFILKMRFVVGYNALNSRAFSTGSSFKDLVNSGKKSIQDFQDFLNEYGVPCKLFALPGADGKKRLFFQHKKPLDFLDNMSSGTRLLTSFYLQFIHNENSISFIFIDEFDAYYHYELSEKIVRLLEDKFDCQVVLTTHNTNLLSNSIMRPDCFFIIHDGKITPICDATPREMRQGHNLEKLYMSGEFDAQ